MNTFVIPLSVPILWGIAIFFAFMGWWRKKHTNLIDLMTEDKKWDIREFVHQIAETSWGKILIGPANIQKELEAAGYNQPDAQDKFDYIRGMLIAAVTICAVIGIITMQILWLAVIMLIKIPEWYVLYKGKSRKQRMREEFIGFAARLAAAISAGMELSRALEWANRRIKKTALKEEVDLILDKMSAGIPLEQGLNDFAEKTGLLEARRVATAIIQAQKYGLSIAENLLMTVKDIRERRQQEIMGRAKTAELKLQLAVLFMAMPTIICTLAALLASMMGQTGGAL